MSQYNSPIYDETRRWIQKKRERGISWADLRYACKSTDSALGEFLRTRQIEDDWPPFSTDAWKELVTEMEEYESKQRDFIFHGHDGALFDENQDNNLQVPENERSCWQLYKNLLDGSRNQFRTWKRRQLESFDD